MTRMQSSVVVAKEIGSARGEVRARYSQLLAYGAETLPLTAEALALADVYQSRRILTPTFYDATAHSRFSCPAK